MTHKPQLISSELLPYQRLSALKHGHARHEDTGKCTPTYQSWQAMLARCRYLRRDNQAKYVKRGITVCAAWQNFENFLADMGERPEGVTLERIDNEKGYSPNNCKWATPVEQARNRRNSRLTYEKALDIAKRMLAGESAVVIAKEFGISESLPRETHKGRTWKDAHHAARNT
jgi:hypothetical protein